MLANKMTSLLSALSMMSFGRPSRFVRVRSEQAAALPKLGLPDFGSIDVPATF
jgi:hypothetical protein